jgi:hypothetical protein
MVVAAGPGWIDCIYAYMSARSWSLKNCGANLGMSWRGWRTCPANAP